MARQLLQDRTPAAYAGVEAYAKTHSNDDACALAWLVVGYAHILDHDYPKAIDPLNRAKARAGDLGDYVTFYLGTSYFQAGRMAEAVSTLADFDTAYPESLLGRDVHVLDGNGLLAEGRPQEAVVRGLTWNWCWAAPMPRRGRQPRPPRFCAICTSPCH
jgi:soluble lytic murein transglycosylase